MQDTANRRSNASVYKASGKMQQGHARYVAETIICLGDIVFLVQSTPISTLHRALAFATLALLLPSKEFVLENVGRMKTIIQFQLFVSVRQIWLALGQIVLFALGILNSDNALLAQIILYLSKIRVSVIKGT